MEEANKPSDDELENAEEDDNPADVGDDDDLGDNNLVEVEEEDINELTDKDPADGKHADNDLADKEDVAV